MLYPDCRVDVDQFYGIEIEEWPARIAKVAMWLMDHQMNQEVFEAFGKPLVRLPLTKSASITVGNALRLDWREILSPGECSYVLGNPPYSGKNDQKPEQKTDVMRIFDGITRAGILDYVTAWYLLAARYIDGTRIRVGFVSTNSITQGEQVGVLWNELFRRGAKIHFGHRTFTWESEARGKAHVHVVIIGWGLFDAAPKRIYDYESGPEHATVTTVQNISPYLAAGTDLVVLSRRNTLCGSPELTFGSMPNDGGHLLLETDERDSLLAREPAASKFVRPFLGSVEFINGKERWCLWLVNVTPAELRAMPAVKERVDGVRKHRLASDRPTTNRLAAMPTLFAEIRQPISRYLAIPKTSSEQRICAHGVSRCWHHRFDRALHRAAGHGLPFRHSFFDHAHGVGASSVRPTEIGLPLLGKPRLQQLPLAAGSARQAA